MISSHKNDVACIIRDHLSLTDQVPSSRRGNLSLRLNSGRRIAFGSGWKVLFKYKNEGLVQTEGSRIAKRNVSTYGSHALDSLYKLFMTRLER